MRTRFWFRLTAWLVVLVMGMCILEPGSRQIMSVFRYFGINNGDSGSDTVNSSSKGQSGEQDELDEFWQNVLKDTSKEKATGNSSTDAEVEYKPAPTPRPDNFSVPLKGTFTLTDYSKWESGEFSNISGLPVQNKRRIRYAQYLPADYSQYEISLSEEINMNIVEYDSKLDTILIGTYKNGDVYEPSRRSAYFSITLFRTYSEKQLSPGQWKGIFSNGIVVELSGSHLK